MEWTLQQREDGPDATGGGQALRAFSDLEDVEAALHAFFAEGRHDDDFLVRYLGTQGEPGLRCLTLNLELRQAFFDTAREAIEDFAGRVRRSGFIVDELLQKVSEEPKFDIRFWLLIYETETHDRADAS